MRLLRSMLLPGIVSALAACELTEVTIVDLTEVFVVEALVTVREDAADNSIRVFLHGTAPGSRPGLETYDNAVVRVTHGGDSSQILDLATVEDCATVRPEDAVGSCFTADASLAGSVHGGEELFLDVELPDGRQISGSTRTPGAFRLRGIADMCRLDPDTRLPLQWTQSEGARSYVSEALIIGLREPLAVEGIESPDSLYLVGVSISESDTTVSFPDQFGVFDRFDLDRDVSVRLQQGLPEGVRADIAITALDENQTNWVRGGNFNPSGAVRVASVTGDGSGAFGSSVTRRVSIVGSASGTGGVDCKS